MFNSCLFFSWFWNRDILSSIFKYFAWLLLLSFLQLYPQHLIQWNFNLLYCSFSCHIPPWQNILVFYYITVSFAGFWARQRVGVLTFGQNIGILPREKTLVGALCHYHTLLYLFLLPNEQEKYWQLSYWNLYQYPYLLFWNFYGEANMYTVRVYNYC